MSRELDYVRELVASAISAPDHVLDVVTLACAVTHKMDDFDSAPRVLALGKASSGKSRVLTVASYLARGAGVPAAASSVTYASYVAEYKLDPQHTTLIDEVQHIFGETGERGKASKLYAYINQGYERHTAWASNARGRTPERVPIFGVVFMAGLGLAVPADMRERAIAFTMERATVTTDLADFSDDDTVSRFTHARRVLSAWTRKLPELSTGTVKGLHPKLAHRMMQVWGPLFAIAQQAGDAWVARTLTAFERIELDSPVPTYTPETHLWLDYLAFTDASNSDGVSSGALAAFANDQRHGAYLSMKPGQFRQFATRILGPTAAYWDTATREHVRGWSGTSHEMNLAVARNEVERLAAEDEVKPDEPVVWTDF
jgi:hypothetical protein